jgi:ribonuclease T1
MMLRSITYFLFCCVLLGLLPATTHAKPPVGSSLDKVAINDLPVEARNTLGLIKKGGPFPYDRDGVVFGNRERVLPKQARGYYTEYTVKTPGAKNRGARRIVAGGDPKTSGEYYYTDDHYNSFKRIQE